MNAGPSRFRPVGSTDDFIWKNRHWLGRETEMTWIRLLERDAPSGEEISGGLDLSSLPDVGDRIAIIRPRGDIIMFEVLARVFEVFIDEDGETIGEECVILEVERLEFVRDEQRLTPNISH